MGQKSVQKRGEQSLQDDDWVEAQQNEETYLFHNVNPFRKRLLLNKKLTMQLIEEYELQFLSDQDYHSYVEDFQWRTSHPKEKHQHLTTHPNDLHSIEPTPQHQMKYVYLAKYFTNTSTQELCSTIYTGLVYLDKVDLRVKEINDIPFSDQLYLYHSTLQGFKTLYEKVGYFDITEEMIFINKQGEVKVWMNPNLSKSLPNYQRSEINITFNGKSQMSRDSEGQGSQSDMIKCLIKIIQDNSDKKKSSIKQFFSTFIQQKGLIDRLSFYKALEQFTNYCSDLQIFKMPQKMKSIYDLYHPTQQSAETNLGDLSQREAESRVYRFTNNRINTETELINSRSSQFLHRNGENQSLKLLEEGANTAHLFTKYQETGFTQKNQFQNSKVSHKSNYSQRNDKNILKKQLKLTPIFAHPQHFNNFSINQHNKHIFSQNLAQVKQKSNNNQVQVKLEKLRSKSPFLKEIEQKIEESTKKYVFIPYNQNIEEQKLKQNGLIINQLENQNHFEPQKNKISFQYKPNPLQRVLSPSKMLINSPSQHLQSIQKQITFKKPQAIQSFQKNQHISQLSSPKIKHAVQPRIIQVPDQRTRFISKHISTNIQYFSSDGVYTLDEELAEDMKKYLGYDPNHQW